MRDTSAVAATLGAALTYGFGAFVALAIVEYLALAPPHQWHEWRAWWALLVVSVGLGLGIGAVGACLAAPWRLRGPAIAREFVLAALVTTVAAAHGWAVVGGYVGALLPGWSSDAQFLLLSLAALASWGIVRLVLGRIGVEGPTLVATVLAAIAILVAARTALRSDEGPLRTALFLPVLAGSVGVAGLALVAIVLRGGRRRALLCASLAAAVIVVGHASARHPNEPFVVAPPPAEASSGPPVVLVVLDTLRADALQLTSSQPSRSPHLAGFASGADVFSTAIANASWTLPGHASLFTGRILGSHRTDVTDQPGFRPALPPEFPTLAELLAGAGYRTSCISANSIVGFGSNLARGCGSYFNPSRAWILSATPFALLGQISPVPLPVSQLLYELGGVNVNATADEIVDAALADPAAVGPGTYLFLNFLDVHGPLTLAPGGVAPDAASVRALRLDLVANLFRRIDIDTFWSRNASALLTYYDSQVGVLDRELARLFEALRRRGLYDPALVVITADHGEAFKENREMLGYFGHHSAWEPAVRIPLLVKRPSQEIGRVFPEPVQQVDVAPTVLGVVGLPAPEGIEGRPLDGGPRGPVVTEWYRRKGGEGFPYFPQNRLAVYRDHYKFVRDGDGAEQLFDLAQSPWELVDVASEQPSLVAELRVELDAVEQAALVSDEDAGAEVDPALADKLRALGYAK